MYAQSNDEFGETQQETNDKCIDIERDKCIDFFEIQIFHYGQRTKEIT